MTPRTQKNFGSPAHRHNRPRSFGRPPRPETRPAPSTHEIPRGLISTVNRRPDSSVHVVPYSTTWPEAFLSERRALEAVLGGVASSIEHTGSTAVPGLSAKPTIDILVVVDSIDELRERIPRIEELGYDHRPSNTLVGSEDHLFLRKVSGGKRTHHLHVVRSGSPEIDDYRLFRDALRENSSLADRYERLKIDLADEHGDDRMRYVTEKANWVGDVVASLRARRR